MKQRKRRDRQSATPVRVAAAALSLASSFCHPQVVTRVAPESPGPEAASEMERVRFRFGGSSTLEGEAPAAQVSGPVILTQTREHGVCVFDSEAQVLEVPNPEETGPRSFIARVDAPPRDIMGGYSEMACGEGRTVLIAEMGIVITLGQGAVRRGEDSMPEHRDRGINAVTVYFSEEADVRRAAHTVDSEGRFFFALSNEGRLVYNDASRDSQIMTLNISDMLQFPARERQPHLIYLSGRLFIFQEGSTRLSELRFDEEGVLTNTYLLRSACPATPTFTISADSLMTVFGNTQIGIHVSRRAGTVVREDSI
ncbi:TPA: hypothetical protein EYP38_00610 [Candidatus Micrarchaeota archaeon]|nr:hypothetical protein [Candidatus Micrarchaeota archaeon]